jgi:hypothetical protein
MTICFSIIKKDFIVVASDALTFDAYSNSVLVCKKFIENTERNYVILKSGHFLITESLPDPRKLLSIGIRKEIRKGDSMRRVSEKIQEFCAEAYSSTTEVELQLQVCGFDGKTPHTFLISTKKHTLIEVAPNCLTGTQAVIDFSRTREGMQQKIALIQTMPIDDVIEKMVRQFVTNAIQYENQIAKNKREQPKTGCGINTLTIYPDRIVWHEPKFYSKDDP